MSALGLSALQWKGDYRIPLPLGISFFTFQSMSYTIDVYLGHTLATRSLLNFATFVSLFPQLVAGPIVRYHNIARYLIHRIVTREGFAKGVKRFVVGLGKKMLIANLAAVAADQIFAIPTQHLTTGLAWLGVAAYTIQIYFDFSGYSDMAIGMGHMLGFRFLENFNYPYISRSISEFWRRWHISLSTWFRDYVYIPLGGSRCRTGRVYFNLCLVFFLCGLWHGASWTFVVWGLYHGVFLVIERFAGERVKARPWPMVQHLYVLLVSMVGWVFFRSETFSQALVFLKAMVGFAPGTGAEYYVAMYLNNQLLIVLLAGAIGSLPIVPRLNRWHENVVSGRSGVGVLVVESLWAMASVVAMAAIFLGSSMLLASGTHNPFIYYRF